MESCVFCDIISGKIPAKKFYEDENFIIIADLNPAAAKHYLAIPKEHYALLSEQTAAQAHVLGQILNKLPWLENKLGLQGGYRLIVNQGENAGQTVKHLHVHILGGETLKPLN